MNTCQPVTPFTREDADHAVMEAWSLDHAERKYVTVSWDDWRVLIDWANQMDAGPHKEPKLDPHRDSMLVIGRTVVSRSAGPVASRRTPADESLSWQRQLARFPDATGLSDFDGPLLNYDSAIRRMK